MASSVGMMVYNLLGWFAGPLLTGVRWVPLGCGHSCVGSFVLFWCVCLRVFGCKFVMCGHVCLMNNIFACETG